MNVKKMVLIGVGVLVVGGVLVNMGSDSKEDSKDKKETTTSKVVKKSEPETPAETDAGDLGDYHVVIKELTLAKDYNGEDVGVIDYEFTNNSDKNAMFLTSITTKAFQNGVALQLAIMTESGYVDSMTEIQPGATLNLKVPYKLTDMTTPISVEATKLFSDKVKLTKEFILE
ncbi:hypothetical protein UAY_01086 [Enterococcus moraviensis ATCC BAA-383]|uniref:DUF5067 domain-containing protein n=1 Tax=Enterococcus moraviensis ATCC BAA-383 TaxID=1158609 RepID=R2T2N4_9ENTE|nr:DUF5067 domain-containing protein [Enterococcus moraviensis]EOI01678.1 hypothetical protein UAY_01086 [Enterococcus moraviensis ATCC BAA-383]EOT73787.1 hypothetical protein I586_00781 [Enterococcus moraviensis ATCC BAA-383]OJG69348.1 hypothetical protein RV09_GL000747 [Enterococcus moraviensis]